MNYSNQFLNCCVYSLLQDNEPGTSQGQASRVSVEELLEQLQITQTELEKVRVSYLPCCYSYFSLQNIVLSH